MSSIDALKEAAGRYPLLTAEEEVILGRAIQQWQQWPGGPDQAPPKVRRDGRRALDKFVCSNQRLALHIAKRFAGNGVPLEDLAQAALEAMVTAFRRFDPSRGFRSSSYSTWYATSGCQQLLQIQATAIRLPGNLMGQMRKLTRARDQLRRARPGYEPTIAELAEASGLDEAQVQAVEQAMQINRTLTIDHQAEAGERGVLTPDVITTSDQTHTLEEHDLTQCVHKAIQCTHSLSPQQRFLLRARFLSEAPLSTTQVGASLNCSPSRVEALTQEAIDVLRNGPWLKDWNPKSTAPSTACCTATPAK